MTSRTVASPRTSVQQSVTQTLEGVGYGLLVANGQLAYADGLRSCKILDPLAFNRREEVAHLAATADGVAAAVSDAAEKAAAKAKVTALIAEVKAAGGEDFGEGLDFHADLTTIRDLFAAAGARCQEQSAIAAERAIATSLAPRRVSFSADEKSAGAEEKRPAPPETSTKLGKREYNACLSNAAATLGLANGYPPDSAPLLESIEDIFKSLASERPSLPPFDTIRAGFLRVGRPYIPRDRDGGFKAPFEKPPSAKEPTRSLILREKSAALEALGIAGSVDSTHPAFQHFHWATCDQFCEVEPTSRKKAAAPGDDPPDTSEGTKLYTVCQMPIIRELDRRIDAACCDPDDQGKTASSYQTRKMVIELWNDISAAMTEGSRVRTLTQAIGRLESRRGGDMFKLPTDVKAAAAPKPAAARGSGQYDRYESRGGDRERYRQSRGRRPAYTVRKRPGVAAPKPTPLFDPCPWLSRSSKLLAWCACSPYAAPLPLPLRDAPYHRSSSARPVSAHAAP